VNWLRLLKFTWLEVLIVLVIIGLLCILICAITSEDSSIYSTKVFLAVGRGHINGFKKNEGRYPDSLKELERYIIQKGFKRLSFIEYYSNPKGNSREFDVLNGEGGWYYNNATGEVKINLTKPAKHYLRFYFGRHRNEIPCNW